CAKDSEPYYYGSGYYTGNGGSLDVW
nr:immunoglobulin heavy chain junction region [Macaca mulatta]